MPYLNKGTFIINKYNGVKKTDRVSIQSLLNLLFLLTFLYLECSS